MSQDDETVERVARAIAAQWAIGDKDLATFTPRALARAALSALPERELLREAMEALTPFAAQTRASGPTEEQHIRRARAAANKIRTAFREEQS